MSPVTNERASRLYAQLGPAVYRRCLRLLGIRAAAEDATQEIFVKLLRDVDRLQDRTTVLPWIYRVATNHCLNLRRDARRGKVAVERNLELMPGTSGIEPESFPGRQLARDVLGLFDRQTQAVVVGVLVDGMELKEAAEVFGISQRTVSRRLQQFISEARAFLSETEDGQDGRRRRHASSR